MREIILVKNGELALKGLNRRTFEDILIKNIRNTLHGFGEIKIRKAQSTVYIEPQEDFDYTTAADRIGKVFGIAAYSRAAVADKNIDDIYKKSALFLKKELTNAKTFKVEAKRADKTFYMTSPQICEAVGGYLLDEYPHLSVDVHNPDVIVYVEIRDFAAYIRTTQLPGAGGMPVGTGGRAAVLISGGIDSPVASYMIAKRGIELTAVHFASPPYTSERALQKVRDLLKVVSCFSGAINFAVVPFTKIQEEIAKNCHENLITVIMRRYMMKIANIIAQKNGCGALITGESLGQVASQTMTAIIATDDASELPVFRPLIGFDKEEIIKIARKIGTFDISALPYEDCCTVFTPKHPKTKPKLDMILREEEKLPESLIGQAVNDTVYERIV